MGPCWVSVGCELHYFGFQEMKRSISWVARWPTKLAIKLRAVVKALAENIDLAYRLQNEQRPRHELHTGSYGVPCHELRALI